MKPGTFPHSTMPACLPLSCFTLFRLQLLQ